MITYTVIINLNNFIKNNSYILCLINYLKDTLRGINKFTVYKIDYSYFIIWFDINVLNYIFHLKVGTYKHFMY